MYYILHKYSSPGWQKTFQNEIDLREELRSHICRECIDGQREYIGSDGEILCDSIEPCDVQSVDSLLSTDCGCEYGSEEIWGDFE